MIPARIVLAVQDSRYVEPLLNYAYGSSYGSALQVTAFTRMDSFLHYMSSGEVPNLVVGDAEMLESWLSRGDAPVPWLLLSEGDSPLSRMEDGSSTPKYQPLPQLLEVMIACCKRNGGSLEKQNAETTPVIGIVSPLGGSGKSTIAMNMAKQLGVLGLRVFYLNLETVNSSALFPSGSVGMEGSFSRLLYDMKASQELAPRTEVSITPYIVRHHSLKCDSFEPSFNVKEMTEMTLEDTSLLLTSLVSCHHYDAIVVDTEGYMGERMQAVLEQAELLIWVLLDDLISMHKCCVWMDQLELKNTALFGSMKKRSRFIVNRFTGQLVNSLPRKDIGIDDVLPYIPSWKQLHQEELLLSSPIYQREVLKLCQQLLDNSGIRPALAGGG
ncbi:hypothetical protein C7121_12555 [Paenibacillus glucanolyticus]|jgi:cellulose biosynthesis protein BcsQ|nr:MULTISPECIES: hypothetical protein [Paenibacillus]ANA79192.1 hypothetical protein A3958_03860 [Paenibacillus glucanolyticus]AVV56879.1 hypothetical protein C7121_12555 [Paenibacillus glucanolyticus]ETT34004.1 hypothetical protein C169_20911 [Paenibacillus sp. FSL R5-808]MDH6675451.1 cellulose biosynthesis protein BcsQ [Paenibacillus sp. LBL]OMF65123.1 hypothetical protein BK142_31280 [Paenibacillus glucanolyticus]